MEEVRTYILSVAAAAILCAMVSTLAGKGGSMASLVKLMTGVVMTAVVIHPLADISVINLNRYLEDLNLDTMAAVEAGTAASREAVESRIKDEVEAYILDKAAGFSLEITAEVFLAEDGSMVPAGVILEGTAAPAARSRMEAILTEELGIPREAVTWK